MTDDFKPYLVLYNRRTGQIIGKPSLIPDDEYPFRVPPDSTAVIRYLDFWKLKDMVESGQFYFCRADKLEDHLEGRYAEANRAYLTKAYQDFLSQFHSTHDPNGLLTQSEIMRSEVYILCWQMLDSERLHMWQTFTTTTASVAICSTFGQLAASLPDDKRIGFAEVKYLDQATPRPEWHSLAPFYAKDPQFKKEKELRCTFARSLEDATSEPAEDGIRLPTQIKPLINKIILHPAAPATLRNEVISLLRAVGVKMKIKGSSLTGKWKSGQQSPSHLQNDPRGRGSF